MVNLYRKGLRVERKVINYLKNLDYEVARVERISKYSKTKDLFNLFDIIALNEQEIRFIQVTTNKPHTHKQYNQFKLLYPFLLVEQWVYKGRNKFMVYKYTHKGKDKLLLNIN